MAKKHSTARTSILDLSNDIDRKLKQASGICDLASVIPSLGDEIPDDALSNAMWAVRDLIEDAEKLAGKLSKHALTPRM